MNELHDAHRTLLAFVTLFLYAERATQADVLLPAATAWKVAFFPREIGGTYEGGKLIRLEVRDRTAYVIKPTGPVDAERRWVWISPYWLGIDRGNGEVEHRMYVERLLGAGFHVAGVDVGTSCGSPTAAEVCHEFYKLVQEKYELNSKARLIGQSNGGLIGVMIRP